MVTDRTELDVQLHGEFVDAGAAPAGASVHATSAAHLRELLQADHRYVFTLIHKFRVDAKAGETTMPVLSDRSDVIVITDEAHRSQYDTLALNMRQALPNAAFMGFTGTPLVAGEELTRQQFGDYVSIYNFRDAIEDGATVPLYYENRIPELQLVNDDFAEELTELLEDAELDDDAEGQLASRFGREYMLLTRPERLRTVARDLVRHFVGRGFTGKAMYVGIDKAAAVRMYDYVQQAWGEHLTELCAQHDALPELERPWLASRIELMETTDMAVVVSQGQNEIAHLETKGLDIRTHRKRMLDEDLAIYGAANAETGVDSPIEDLDELVVALDEAIDEVINLCARQGVDLIALRDAHGFDYIARRDKATEALLADPDIKDDFLAAARQARKLFKALLPDPTAGRQQTTVAVIRLLAEHITGLTRPTPADLDAVTDAVEKLLDRSVGAEEYVIRAAAASSEPDPLLDLSQIDFEGLSKAFAGKKRAETDRLAALLKQRATNGARQNPTRYDLVERIEALIAAYNAGSVNIDEYLRRLVELSKDLTAEEQRAATEGMNEAELAIFDLLTQPEPVLSRTERDTVKASAKRLLSHIQEKLVLDWRRRASTTAEMRVTIRDALDADLPAEPYPPAVFDAKVQAIFDHVTTAYGNDGESVYADAEPKTR